LLVQEIDESYACVDMNGHRGGEAECERVVLLQLPGPQIRDGVSNKPSNHFRVLESNRKGSNGAGSDHARGCRDEENVGVLQEQSSEWHQNWVDHA